jgi:hypothetical protein
MFDMLIDAMLMLMRLDIVLMISGELVLGMLVGALPGFTTVMAMAIVLPISFFPGADPGYSVPDRRLQGRHLRGQYPGHSGEYSGHRGVDGDHAGWPGDDPQGPVAQGA